MGNQFAPAPDKNAGTILNIVCASSAALALYLIADAIAPFGILSANDGGERIRRLGTAAALIMLAYDVWQRKRKRKSRLFGVSVLFLAWTHVAAGALEVLSGFPYLAAESGAAQQYWWLLATLVNLAFYAAIFALLKLLHREYKKGLTDRRRLVVLAACTGGAALVRSGFLYGFLYGGNLYEYAIAVIIALETLLFAPFYLSALALARPEATRPQAEAGLSRGLVFDGDTPELIRPQDFYGVHEKICDVCVVTFSRAVVEKALERFACERVAQLGCINGLLPVYALDHKGKKIAFYMSFVGATGAGTCIEEVNCLVGTTKFVMFGSSGSLRPDIAAGKLVVPAEAYRDEGMSYHYAPPSEYIAIRNADRVADFLEGRGIPHVKGRVWTTDGVYRETAGKAAARRSEGCLAVEMECAGVQAVCDYRGWEYYDFLFAGDLLEEEGWDARILGNDEEIDHQMRYFLLALEFAATL